MPSDKHQQPDGAGPSAAVKKGKDPQEAVIFNPDGSIQERRQIDGKDTPQASFVESSPVKKSIKGTQASLPPDMNPALLKRISKEAEKTVEGQADALAETIYSKFVELLTNSIADKGGNLTMDDVAEMGESFRAEIGDIRETFIHAVETYTEAREENRAKSARAMLFQRIIVHRFEDRFVSEENLDEKPEHLSRRILPGFHSTLSMMFGPPKLEKYERQMGHLAEKIREENHGQMEWADLYNSPETRRIALRGQIEIAQHFKDADKRLDWMVAMINSNLIPSDNEKLTSKWGFTRKAAEGMLGDMFYDLKQALHSDAARQKFTEELGAETVEMLDGVTQRFH